MAGRGLASRLATATGTRRLALGALAMLALAAPATGCGGGEDRSISPALEAALAYLPADPAFAIVLPTDLERAPVRRLESRASELDGWSELRREWERQVAEDFDYEREVRPQLGNPLVLTASTLDANDPQEYGALQVTDTQALRRAIERNIARGRERRLAGHRGALITRDVHQAAGEDPDEDFRVNALHRDVLVQADSRRQIVQAIDRSAGSDNLAGNGEIASELDRTTPDLLLRVIGDSGRLLEDSRDEDTVAARKLKWVRALGRFSAAAFAAANGVRFEFEQKTDGERLTQDDLPLASGPEPALLHDRDAPIVAGLREPDRLFRFIEAALRASDPKQYAQYEAAIRQLRALGTDVHEDVLRRIANLSVALRNDRAGTFQLNLAEGAGDDLRTLLDASGAFLEGAFAAEEAGAEIVTQGSGEDRVWTVRRRSGEPLVRYTVRGDRLVGSLGRVLPSPPVDGGELPGAEGALALALAGERFADLVREIDREGTPELRGSSGRQALRLLSALGSFRLSLRAETGALTGRGELLLPRGRQRPPAGR